MASAKKRENYNKARIRRHMPHQVALPDEYCCLENYEVLRDFNARFDPEPGIMSVTAKWPSGYQRDFRLFCFAHAEDAAEFAAHFEGEMFDPRQREGGRVNGAWIREGRARAIEQCGPLKLPRFFKENP